LESAARGAAIMSALCLLVIGGAVLITFGEFPPSSRGQPTVFRNRLLSFFFLYPISAELQRRLMDCLEADVV